MTTICVRVESAVNELNLHYTCTCIFVLLWVLRQSKVHLPGSVVKFGVSTLMLLKVINKESMPLSQAYLLFALVAFFNDVEHKADDTTYFNNDDDDDGDGAKNEETEAPQIDQAHQSPQGSQAQMLAQDQSLVIDKADELAARSRAMKQLKEAQNRVMFNKTWTLLFGNLLFCAFLCVPDLFPVVLEAIHNRTGQFEQWAAGSQTTDVIKKTKTKNICIMNERFQGFLFVCFERNATGWLNSESQQDGVLAEELFCTSRFFQTKDGSGSSDRDNDAGWLRQNQVWG